MNKELKRMYREIINNKHLMENIPPFLKLMADSYYTAAGVRLALHYFTYYEMYCDDKVSWDQKLLEYSERINKVISRIGKDNRNEDYNGLVKETDEIRSGIMERMDFLTAFADLFEIYEYALNRVEYRFKDMEQLDDDEEIARDILRYIFDPENDNVVINYMIKEVIGELPVRITKQKYFEYLRNGFNELFGASKDSFENYIYIIRSCAMLDMTDDSKDIYPDLWEKKSYLENLNFKNITKEEYQNAMEFVSEAGAFLETESTAYYSLMELVNELYALMLCAPYEEDEIPDEGAFDSGRKEAAFYIIKEINKAYFEDKQDEIQQDVIDKFKILEGYQEETEFDILRLEDALFHINEEHRALAENLTEDDIFSVLLLCKDLLSDSLFIDLHNEKSEGIISKERFEKEVDKLIEDLAVKLKSCDRMIMRAIMARTINKVPVFFTSHSEVMNYILYSLNKCTDPAEKYACLEVINEIMDYQLL